VPPGSTIEYDYKTAKRREYVEATGWPEAEALADLAELLRGWRVEDVAGDRP
jgi:hypothetical protein